MTEEQLTIDGKSYISSTRAAQLFGYTKDYVGQLARAGKIESQLIGRSWYVEEDSMRKHKLTVHYTLTKPKKTRKNKQESYPRHFEQSDEIPSINIHNSDATEVPVHQLLSKLWVNDELAKVPHAEQDEEQHDLFPRPHKDKSRDALIKSDFLYEQDSVPDYTKRPYRTPYAAEVETDANDGSIDGVLRSAQRIRVHTRESRKAVETVSFANMDGVLPTSAPERTKHTSDSFEHADHEVSTENQSMYEDEYMHRAREVTNERGDESEARPSRAFALLGAVIVFLTLTVLYLLVR